MKRLRSLVLGLFALCSMVGMAQEAEADDTGYIVKVGQVAPFGTANEMIVVADESEQKNLISKLVEKGVSLIIVPDHFNREDMLLKIKPNRNMMIFSFDEAYQLIKMRGFYFISGLVAVIYPKEESEIGQQYVIVKNNLCGRSSTKVVHIVEKNVYIVQAGKTFVELVDGPSLQPNIVYT